MHNVIYLNRWGAVFHVVLDRTDGTIDYRLHSAVYSTLAEARDVAAVLSRPRATPCVAVVTVATS